MDLWNDASSNRLICDLDGKSRRKSLQDNATRSDEGRKIDKILSGTRKIQRIIGCYTQITRWVVHLATLLTPSRLYFGHAFALSKYGTPDARCRWCESLNAVQRVTWSFLTGSGPFTVLNSDTASCMMQIYSIASEYSSPSIFPRKLQALYRGRLRPS